MKLSRLLLLRWSVVESTTDKRVPDSLVAACRSKKDASEFASRVRDEGLVVLGRAEYETYRVEVVDLEKELETLKRLARIGAEETGETI